MAINVYINLFRRYLRSQPASVTVMIFLLLLNIALLLALPNIASRFIQDIVNRSTIHPLIVLALLYMLVACVGQAVSALAVYWSELVGWTATNKLRGDLMEHVLDLDLTYHESHSAGEMIERIDGDVNQVNRFFSSFVVGMAGNALLLLGIVIALSFISVLIGLSFAMLTLIGLALLARVTRVGTPHWETNRRHSSLFYGELGELLGATEDVRALNAESYAMSRFYRRVREWLPVEVQAASWGSSIWIATILLFTAATMLAYGEGGVQRQHDAISLSALYVVIAYALMLTGPMEAIRNELQDVQQAAAAIRRISDLFSVASELADGTETGLPSGALDVEFRHVSFGYRSPGDTEALPARLALPNLNFTLAAGRTLGLVGRTGSGKSTIASLLFRNYDPQVGQVRIGGHNVRDLKLAELRDRIGLVTQHVYIFDASLRDNLTFFEQTADDSRLVDVLEAAGLAEWLSRLPSGLDTRISPDSVSAGEAQLIAFARVFLKNPGLLILDEPSSRLDPATEAHMREAVDALMEDRTVVLIAHRLETLRFTDEILVIDNGEVVEHGSTASLLNSPDSIFATLLRAGGLVT